MPAGCFCQFLFLVSELESFSVRFNKGFVYNFMNSSLARPSNSTESELIRDFEAFKIGLMLKKAREEKKLTQEELAELVDKNRAYISRIENNGSNITLKTLFEIVEKGLGGKVKISIEF